MNVRRRYIPIAVGWTILVAVLVVVAPLPWLDRLPDPYATHWGLSGKPDGASPYWEDALVMLFVWAVLAAVPLHQMIWGAALRQRHARGWMCAILAGGGVFALAIQASTILANLDRADWRDAAPIGPGTLLAVLGAAALAGAAGWVLARPGPDEASSSPRLPEPMRRLRPGERAVWVSSASARWGIALGGGLLVLAIAFATVIPIEAELGYYLAATLGMSGLVGLMVSAVRAQVDPSGLTIALGPLRRPMRRIPLSRMDRAWVETLHPSDVGGWGYRVRSGRTAIMIRGGECLVIRYVSGRELVVSVDDAERGAALLNSLITEHAGNRS